jgi:tRNA-modifying protein YgfZ
MAINIPTSQAVHWWRPAAWLRVTGGDAESFLQGQFSNDVRGLVAGAGAVYGLWLDVKGRVLADSFVMRGGGGGNDAGAPSFWVGSYYSPAAAIRQRLESYVIADDVVIEDATGGWAGVSLLGPGAFGSLTEKCHLMGDTFPGQVFRGRRTDGENAEWVFPMAAVDQVRAAVAGWAALDAVEMERQRIAAGIPAVPVDVGPGDLPNEGGLETTAISYTKGCYLGQEVIARLKSMGRVRRRLLRVRGTMATCPALPAPLLLGERVVGELRSAVPVAGGGWGGLAMLSLLHLTPAAELALAAGGEPAVRLADQP